MEGSDLLGLRNRAAVPVALRACLQNRVNKKIICATFRGKSRDFHREMSLAVPMFAHPGQMPLPVAR